MSRYTFVRKAGRFDFSEASLRAAGAERFTNQLTAPPAFVDAAHEAAISEARKLAFESHRPFHECIKFVLAERPLLARTCVLTKEFGGSTDVQIVEDAA